MLYCPQCHRLQDQETAVCSVCQGIELRKPVYEDMVVLSECSEAEANVLSTILSNAEIAFHKQETRDRDPPNFSSERSDCCTVMVSYGAWDAAQEAMRHANTAFGSLYGEGQVISMDSAPSKEYEEKQLLESRKKKLLTRIVLFVLFILLIWGVVVLSDTGIAFVKGLFANG